MIYETDEEFISEFLIKECHYLAAKAAPNNSYVAIAPMFSTVAIITGTMGDTYGYHNRWCYHRAMDALAAYLEWDGQAPEPVGWHRHPGSGRRIAEDDETYDENGKLVPKGALYVRQ